MKARVCPGCSLPEICHIGNYLGGTEELGEDSVRLRVYLFISICTPSRSIRSPRSCRRKSPEIAALYLAAGIDPQGIRRDGSNPRSRRTPSLAWMLTCVTPIGWLERMTQFKPSRRRRNRSATGCLQYPVLMAADILLYQAAIVPVGEDQSQHLELTARHCAAIQFPVRRYFRDAIDESATVGARVMGLDDPTRPK